MIVFWWIVTALAVYRVARMFAMETGPFGVFRGIREQVKKQITQLYLDKYTRLFDNSIAYKEAEENWINEGFGCVFCQSFWIAFMFCIPIAFKFQMNPLEYILTSLSVSGIVVCIHRYFG